MNVTTENLYQVIDIMFPPRENEEPTNETFYRIIDDFTDGNNNQVEEGVEAEGGGEEPQPMVTITPTVTITEGNLMTAITPTAYLRRRIPIGDGFMPRDFIEMGYRLGCDHMELIHELIRTPSRGGITIDLISAVLLVVYRRVVVTDDDGGVSEDIPTVLISEQAASRNIVRRIAPQLTTVESVPRDEICAICLETPPSSPVAEEDHHQPWSIAAGCSLHRFHTECIERWMGGTCPTCRAQLCE